MSNKDDSNLERSENWNYEGAERQAGKRTNWTEISIAFPREDWDQISTSAEQVHERVSEFVRAAALESVRRLTAGATPASSSGSGWLLVTHRVPSKTRLSGANASGTFPMTEVAPQC